jgi:hypothetical protein
VVRWPVELAKVDGARVTLAQPLRFDLPPGGRAHLHHLVGEGLLREVGVERLTMVMRRQGGDSFGWNGPFFQNTVHGFVREVTVIDADLGGATAGAKNITIADLALTVAAAPADHRHRGVALRALSHDVLVEGLDMDPRRFWGISLEASGVVVSRARGDLGYVNGFAVDSVLTEITRAPGTTVGAARGRRFVGWNLGELVPDGIPANLHAAQARLGQGQ